MLGEGDDARRDAENGADIYLHMRVIRRDFILCYGDKGVFLLLSIEELDDAAVDKVVP